MPYLPPSSCPVCGNHLTITIMSCDTCGSQLSGSFAPCKYCTLSDKQRLFLDTFLKCRGNIKEVERTLSLSYPTVKGMLDELLYALFQTEITHESSQEQDVKASEILDMLEKNEITAAKAAEMLSKLKQQTREESQL